MKYVSLDPEAYVLMLEDELHQAVLAAVAEGRCAAPEICAKLAISTKEIKFDRWYA